MLLGYAEIVALASRSSGGFTEQPGERTSGPLPHRGWGEGLGRFLVPQHEVEALTPSPMQRTTRPTHKRETNICKPNS